MKELTPAETGFVLAILGQLQWRIDQRKEFELASSVISKLRASLEEPKRVNLADLAKAHEGIEVGD